MVGQGRIRGIQSTSARADTDYPPPPATRLVRSNPVNVLGDEAIDRSCDNSSMRIASGKVVAGRVELDGELPEGA